MSDGASRPTSATSAQSRPADERSVDAYWTGGSARVVLPANGKVVVGRSSSCELVIDDESVSRQHVAIYVGDVVVIEDLGSRNGTRVAGRALGPGERIVVTPGLAVQVGDAIVMLNEHGHSVLAPVAAGAPAVPRPEHASGSPMEKVERLVATVARSPVSVILTGETGVGKEVFAERIHALSPRSGRPFVAFNCAAVSETLAESELFGHEKGAFTGAHARKIGLFESADGGTVFLDEVGEMSPSIQAKLLRALEKREVVRVGSVTPVPFDVRFVSATHRSLPAQLKAGSFRADLYYRLNGITIQIPPLRERHDEILVLARRFAERSAKLHGLDGEVRFGPDAIASLTAHAWPGNVRELRNVVERAVLLSGGLAMTAEHVVLDVETVDEPLPAPPPVARAKSADSGDERGRILEALEAANGNQTTAAARLGISRRTLTNKLNALGISGPRKNRT